ncbi:hypothetical protein HG717_16410 [Rhodococcus erythropolis]|uniref:hypothetical protein n=1 Tax=Rhodococcus erythropolis TaxID=1833 RepID=UPI001C9B978A|nr:hypothetical protein [Rhodococcus erythropolis]MBY6385482.1 hypothetical protein [Rhodococcus erythropolis]
MTGVDVEHTKALEAAATPGPWYWDEDNWLDVAAAHYVIEPDDDGFEDTTQLKVRPEDKEFIAHARTAVPALVAAVERVQALHEPWTVDGHRKLPTGGHLWRILWPWFLPAYGQIVPHLL